MNSEEDGDRPASTTVNEIILHHYAGSPFSEKVRLVLGLKKLAWKSVIVPVMLPKPDVVALTGGYRRTPFMQIGADVYCDSALMCRVIDRLAPQPPLYPADSAGITEIVAQWADSALFWAAVPYTMQPAGVAHVFAGAPPEFLKAFRDDRAAMTAGMRRPSLADGRVQLASYCSWLERLLAHGGDWLIGAAPSIADFSVAQSIWFIRRAPPVATVLAPYPKLLAWYERVHAFGHGEQTEMSSAEALLVSSLANAHATTAIAAGQAFEAGAEVVVTPSDYAPDPVAGRLVGLDNDEVVIARHDERAGRVHVHFPRI
ncbi:MAG: glutathione S-transferase family protein, partial [Pseudomonadota bacterium]|nr:glutathione S-transferase family protein [Pseudomonadota bacterium]